MSKFLIAGLGNIGEEYVNTRHNIGFSILDHFARAAGSAFATDRLASVMEVKLRGKIFFCIKPSTYMNLSGRAVSYWMQAERIPIQRLLVIADDLALPFGKIRIRKQGSDGGHNGLRSIIETLGSANFARLRFGIGDEFAKGKQSDYVLDKWTEKEMADLPSKIETAAEAIGSFAFTGVERAMNMYNAR